MISPDMLILNDSCSLARRWKSILHSPSFQLKLLLMMVSIILNIVYAFQPVKNPLICFIAGPSAIVFFIIIILNVIDQQSVALEMYSMLLIICLCIVGIVCFFIAFRENFNIMFFYKMLIADMIVLMVFDLFILKFTRGCQM